MPNEPPPLISDRVSRELRRQVTGVKSTPFCMEMNGEQKVLASYSAIEGRTSTTEGSGRRSFLRSTALRKKRSPARINSGMALNVGRLGTGVAILPTEVRCTAYLRGL